jgi:hypothetical protein
LDSPQVTVVNDIVEKDSQSTFEEYFGGKRSIGMIVTVEYCAKREGQM